MKKLVYLICGFLIILGCSSREASKAFSDRDSIESNQEFVDPFDIEGDYSYLDSIDKEIKTHSYQMYGDSNALENGLPDSIMRRKDSIERLRRD